MFILKGMFRQKYTNESRIDVELVYKALQHAVLGCWVMGRCISFPVKNIYDFYSLVSESSAQKNVKVLIDETSFLPRASIPNCYDMIMSSS